MAPTRPARMTVGSISWTLMSPLPIVFATAVPNPNAAMKSTKATVVVTGALRLVPLVRGARGTIEAGLGQHSARTKSGNESVHGDVTAR